MKDLDEPFQAPIQILVVVMYARAVDDYILGLVEIDICARSSLLITWAL